MSIFGLDADSLAGGEAPAPDNAAWAEMTMKSGLNRGSNQQFWVDINIPPTIYDTKPNEKLEAASEQIIGKEDTWRSVAFKALGCGVTPMTFVRQKIAYALTHATVNLKALFPEENGKMVIPADQKRNKAEDHKDKNQWPELNKVLQAYLREPSYTQLNYQAMSIGVSTHAALIAMLDAICETPTTYALILDSNAAMDEYRKAKKKTAIIADFLHNV